MKPGERVDLTRKISERMNQEEWSMVDLILRQFDSTTTDMFNDDKIHNIIDMLDGAHQPSLPTSVSDTPGEGTNEIASGVMTIAGAALAAGAGGQFCEKGGKVAQAGANSALNWLNRGRYFRVGAGRHDGRRVRRVAGDWVKWLENRGVPGIRNGHIDIKDLGPWTGR